MKKMKHKDTKRRKYRKRARRRRQLDIMVIVVSDSLVSSFLFEEIMSLNMYRATEVQVLGYEYEIHV